MTLILSSDFPEPGVCGIRRPKLVLPKRVVEALTDQELEAVLLHEVAHVRRHDNLVESVSVLVRLRVLVPSRDLAYRSPVAGGKGACV